MKENIKYSIQDFSLVNSYVNKCTQDFNVKSNSNGFYFFLLDLILNLQEDEIRDSITDSYYLQTTKQTKGHDRGIDAIYIDTNEDIPIIHFFNCKYTNNFEKCKNSNFPSSEIDKILSFINCLMAEDTNLKNEINNILYNKVEEIWEIFKNHNPKFVFHLCANMYNGLEASEKTRFEREIHKNSHFTIQYELLSTLVNYVNRKDTIIVNGKVQANKKELFEKSDGDIRALIVNLNARDVIRLVLDNDDIRNTNNINDFSILKEHKILEDAFSDNVRLYLKQRPRINRNIKETALSEENSRFFYFNNGITMTCSHFEYPRTQAYPIIELENIQIVNGSQTIHALYEALTEDYEKIENVELLCRIYEIRNKSLSSNIAEYTNSQNPVKSRDIRSIDFVQKKLEQEFFTRGLFYERKKGQYNDKPKNSKIDSEKVGQVLLAFYNSMPSEAKNKKSIIFAEKYEEIFNDTLTVDKVLLPYKLYENIEELKEFKKLYINNSEDYEKESYLLHSTYYLLYIMHKLSIFKNIDLDIKNHNLIWNLYSDCIKIIESVISAEKSTLKEKYNHASFFKSNKPKIRIETLFENKKVNKILE